MEMKLEPEKLVIRPLKKEDLEEVIRIDEEYTGKRREEYYRRLMKEILEPEYALITSLAAEYDGKLVGFIAGVMFSGEFGIPENIAYLTTIGVDKSFLKHGIGRELFRQFATNVKAAGAQKIHTIVEWANLNLLKFFSRAGFKLSSTLLNLELEL
ncbi:MAG: GCN5-related N-acetyltransferase [Candidatus Hecatellales archaeon B24]|nr:MAG: GCN5-related N-acetyltransferase [Candidatus Hecatellales archaeon B24]